MSLKGWGEREEGGDEKADKEGKKERGGKKRAEGKKCSVAYISKQAGVVSSSSC